MKTSEPKMSKEDQRWRAESDFRDLVRAEEIRMDPKRLEAALKVGKEMQKATRAALSEKE